MSRFRTPKVSVSFKSSKRITESAHAKQCDVHRIARTALRSNGLVDHLSRVPGLFADFSEVPDFHTAQNLIAAATQEFQRLPASIRNEFGNDMANYVRFMQDPKNADEAVRLGLATKRSPAPKVATLDDVVSALGELTEAAASGEGTPRRKREPNKG